MKHLRVIICDDEPLAVEWLERMLKRIGDVSIVQSVSNGEALLRQIEAITVDLVLLDIEMPGLDGFDVVDALSRISWDDNREPPLIVFVTAHSQFAAKAFDSGALDFVSKPVRFSRVKRAVQRAQSAAESRQARRRLHELTKQLEELKRIHTEVKEEPYVWLRRGAETTRLDIRSIDWVAAEGEYVRFHSGDLSYLERDSISQVATRLEPLGFVRIHRSTVVNSRSIKSLVRTRWGHLNLRLQCGVELRVSKTFRRTIAEVTRTR